MSDTKRRRTVNKLVYKGLVIFIWLIFWEILSRIIGKEVLLPSPPQVFVTVIKLGGSLSFWLTIANSSIRIVSGFLLALIIGIILAVLSYISFPFLELISPVMKVIKATPVASFTILALIWISSRNLSVLMSFLMVVPVIFTNVLEGLKNADEEMLQMAKVYRLGRIKRVKAVYLPAVIPFLISAVGVGLGFGFKSGIAAEVIGISSNSIGEKLYEAKLYLMTKEMFAWTIVIIIISVIFEKSVLAVINLLHGIYGKNMTSENNARM